MSAPSLSQETIYYGGASHRPPMVTELRAGSLRCQYEEGNLRYIRAGNTELLRMIYSAVRDHNWDTIAPQLANEQIEQQADHFTITYDCRYRQGDIDFRAQYRIRGAADGSVQFSMEGEALRSFRRNRIGFCVLHPASTAGASCKIETAEQESSEDRFPVYIRPHQPFYDIQRMEWEPAEGVRAVLEFEGDLFETEDQRNWTDDSFKTYCTPLGRPFPVTVSQGETIRQTVTLRLLQDSGSGTEKETPLRLEISEKSLPRPAIGLGRSTETDQLDEKAREQLAALRFSHYRVDLRLFEADWSVTWQRSTEEAAALGWPLEVALHFSREYPQELADWLRARGEAEIKSVTIFHRDHKTTPPELLDELLPDLRRQLPEAAIGAGTDHFFTELNRDRVSATHLDFLSYSVNPQVHQFDNQSLIETLQAQAYTVDSARQFADGTPIHVSPVTLRMRRNPNATGPEPPPTPDTLPTSVDTRQLSLFGAGWTLGSLRNLIGAGAASITYYETTGRKGILPDYPDPLTPDLFPADPGKPYPMYWLFRFLLAEERSEILTVRISHPWQIEALAFRTDSGERAVVANLQPREVSVQLPETRFSSVKLLDETALARAGEPPNDFLHDGFQPCSPELHLPPYALAFLRSAEADA